MSIIGQTVICKQMLGVVLGYSQEPEQEEFLRVHIWDTDLGTYRIVLAYDHELLIVEDPLILQLTNEDDTEIAETYAENTLDQTLATTDKKWFDETLAALKEFEEGKLKVGSVVMDGRKNLGVIISKPNKQGIVIVHGWVPAFRKYMEFPKKLSVLYPADPRGEKKWNDEVNLYEREIRENIREVFSDLSLMTNNKEWFERINQKETSDGA